MHTPTKSRRSREHVREQWDRIAADFDRFATPHTLRLGEEAIQRAGVGRGTRFLDVGAGSGALSISAARRGARLLATDISRTMLVRLLTRARAEALAEVEVRPMDGHALDLEDDSFDLTGSQNGVSLFPDFPRGLAEMVRVTRPGGRVMIVSFGPIQEAEFLTFFMGALRAVVHGFNSFAAGATPLELDSGKHLWEVVTSSNPVALEFVGDLSEAQRDEVRRVLVGMLRERSGSAGGVLRNTVNIGIGRKRG